MSGEPQRAAIVYASSHHGNTAKVAQIMAGALDAELLTADSVQDGQLMQYQLVGFGSGIYFARHHRLLLDLVKSAITLPDRVFLFSTAGLPFLSSVYHGSLRRRLVSRGCTIVGEFSCRGWDTVGPLILIGGINWFHPNARDLDRAVSFARQLRQSMS